ncbi:hypothetical protein RCC89_19345 [Cytophagaceae bacterium ABcell3]|nr:hypothetical protein RCC89_19305 [Cytophagaceae bacterium ABcell3]WMJ75297.1 hypothetical protein RCC89_19345 [Cytophagaceae bacterium ABcell3]
MGMNEVLQSKYQTLFVVLNIFLITFFVGVAVLVSINPELFSLGVLVAIVVFCILISIGLILNVKFVIIKNGEIKIYSLIKRWSSNLQNVKIRTYDFSIDDSYMLFKKINLILIKSRESVTISDIHFSNLRAIEELILKHSHMSKKEKESYRENSLSIDTKQAKRIIFFGIVNICFLAFCSTLLVLKFEFGVLIVLIQTFIWSLLILLALKTIKSFKTLHRKRSGS